MTISALSRSHTQLFILGMNGSGTTMLLDVLSRSEDVYSFPYESRIIPYLLSRAGSYDLNDDEQYHRYFKLIANHPIICRANNDQPVPCNDKLLASERTPSRIIDYVFMYFASKEKRNIWCEKSPQNVQAIDEILAAFPEAIIIHLIRDGRDCAASLHRRWKRDPTLIISRWKNVVRKGSAACKKYPNNCIEIRYEELVSHPNKFIKKICSKAGIHFNETMLESKMPWVEQSVVRGISFHGYKWKKYFSPEQNIKFESIAGKVLHQNGYEVDNQGDEALNPLLTKLIRGRDFIFAYIQEITSKISGKNAKSWKTITGLPLVSFYEFLAKKD